MNIFLKRIFATIIDIFEGILFAIVVYYTGILRFLINLDFLIVFFLCYSFSILAVLILTRRKTLGEVFFKIRLINKNTKNIGLIKIIARNLFFAVLLTVAAHDYDRIIWLLSFLIFTIPYSLKEGANGLDFLFNTKYVEDKEWAFNTINR